MIIPVSATNTNSDYVMLDVPWVYINQCGHQVVSGPCQAYCWAYCNIILKNKPYTYRNFYVSGVGGVAPATAGYNTGNQASSSSELLKIVYDNINIGRPVVLRVFGSQKGDGTYRNHYVVAIGYKANSNPNQLKTSDILILDPANGNIKQTANSNPTYTLLSSRTLRDNGYWTAKSGESNVINGGDISTVTPVTKLTFSNLTTPGNLTEGQSGHVNGYVYSTNSPICSITAEVYRENGQRELSASSSGFSVSQYGPIKNSKIDSSLKFGTLPAGTYYIKYTAKALDGTTATAKTESFTVAGEAAPAPIATKITFENLSTPGNLTEGQDGHIGGSIYSSNSPIRYVTFDIYEENGRLVSNGWTDEEINDSQYTLRNSEIDTALKFDKFSAGTYYIKYAAVTEDGTTTSATTNTFTIVPKPATTTNEDQPEWGPWSNWSATPVQATATRQVETRTVKVSDAKTQYRYGRFVANGHDCWCATYLQKLGYGQGRLDYSEWTTTRYSTSGKDWSCGYCNGNHQNVDHTSSNGTNWWKEYRSPSGQSYYWEETQTVPATYETQYRYRDRIN